MDDQPRVPPGRASLTLAGVLALWLVAMLVGTLVAQVAVGSQDDDLGSAGAVAAALIIPPLFGLVVTVYFISRRGWWSRVLRDSVPARSWVWAVPAIVVVGALISTDWARLGDAGAGLVLWLLLGVLTVAVSEELLFRGFVLTALRDSVTEPVAAGWTLVLFALAHSVGSLELNPLQIVSTAAGGVVYYLTKRVSASLWPAVLLHALDDFSLFSITLGPGETDDNRAPYVFLAAVVAALVALIGAKWIAPRRSAAAA